MKQGAEMPELSELSVGPYDINRAHLSFPFTFDDTGIDWVVSIIVKGG